MTDTRRRGGRQADWLAGRSSPTRGFDTDATHFRLPFLSDTCYTAIKTNLKNSR